MSKATFNILFDEKIGRKILGPIPMYGIQILTRLKFAILKGNFQFERKSHNGTSFNIIFFGLESSFESKKNMKVPTFLHSIL